MLAALLPAGGAVLRATTAHASGSAYASAILGDGPAIYYRLDEASGPTAHDSTANHVDGTYAASGLTFGVTGALVGDTDTAVTSSGSAAAVTASAASLPTGSGARTLEVWVKSTASSGALISYGSTSCGGCGFAVSYWSNGTLLHFDDQSGTFDATLPYAISDGNWHSVAVTYNGSTFTDYYDGQEIASTTISLSTPAGTTFQVGGTPNGSTLAGSIDEAAAYATALTGAQIDAHWAAATAVGCQSPPTMGYGGAVMADSPVRYYGFSGTSTRAFADFTSSCRTGAYTPAAVRQAIGPFTGDADSISGTGPLGMGAGGDGLPAGAAARTIELWEKSSAGASGTLAAYGGNGGGGEFGISMLSGSLLRLRYDGAHTVDVATPLSIGDSNWHQLAISYDGTSTAAFYMDGQEFATGSPGTLGTVLPGNGLFIGSDRDGNVFTGSLDEVAVYATALGPSQINAHWRAATGSACGSAPTSGYGHGVATDGASRFYRFGETGGRPAADSSGGCHVGTYAITTSHDRGPVIGETDGAVGGTGPFLLASPDGLPSGSAARTIEAWMKVPVGTSSTMGVVSWGGGCGNCGSNLVVWGNPSNTWVQFNYTGGWVDVATPASIFNGAWHQIAVTYDGGTQETAYLDGAAIGGGATNGTLRTTIPDPAGFQVGSMAGQDAFTGDIAEVAVYPTVLSGSQLSNHFTSAEPVGGALTVAQSRGDTNYCIPCHGGVARHGNLTSFPIDTATGNFWHIFDDLSIPGRGLGLSITRTYNSSAASINGPLGYGWQLDQGMSLTVSGTSPNQVATITQENGSQASFAQPSSGSSWPPTAPRFIATLVSNADGTWTFVRQAQLTFTFNSAGELTRAVDLNGYVTTYSYTGTQLTGISDAGGRSLTLGWTGTHLTSVADANGAATRTVQYQYNDGNGNLTDVIDVGGNHWQFAYDAGHHLTTMKDPNCVGSSGCPGVQNVYDAQGRVTSQTDQLGRATTFDYTSVSSATKVTDPSGHVVVDYYSFGLRTATTRGYGTASAATTKYGYDPSTLALVTTTDPNGHTTADTVDASGNVLTATDPLGRQEVKTYNAFNEVLTDKDGNGVTTTNMYDASGNLTSTSRPDTTDNTTATTTYFHDDGSHPGDVSRVLDADLKTWHFTFDQYGLGLTATDPLGNETITCHDSIGRATWTVAPRGSAGLTPATVCAQATSQETQSTQTPPAFTAVVSYLDPASGHLDGYGLVHATVDADGHTTTTTYDADQNATASTDALQKITRSVYDAANELTQSVRGSGTPQQSTEVTDYNPDGTVLDQVDGAGAKTTYGYDSLGRATAVTTPATPACPSGCTTTTTYDGAGNRLSRQEPGGNCAALPAAGCTTYSYDVANQLTGVQYSDGVTPNVSSIQYDGDGQRTAMTDGTGNSAWTYDSLHRLRSSTDGAAVAGGGVTVSYTYDLLGHLTGLTYPSGLHVTRGYDDAGRLTTIADSQTGKTITVTPDADSNVTGIQYPNTTTATMTFDNADVLTGITDTQTGNPTPIASFGYTRDADNQVASSTSAGALTDNHTYGYTPLNQVSEDNSAAYGYDVADNLTQLADGTQQRFDSANELASKVLLVGAQQQAPTLGTSVSVSLPSGVQAGDEILVATTQVSTATATAPAGYSIEGSVTSTGTPATTTQLFAKKAAAGEPNPTITYSAPAQPAIVVAAYRGIASQITDAPVQTASTASGTQITVGGFGTTAIGDQLVMIGGASGNATARTWTAPIGMTVRAQTSTQTLGTSGLFDETMGAPGTVGSQSASMSGAAQPMTGILLALKPVAPTYDARGNRTTTPLAGGGTASLTYDQENRLTAFNGTATYAYNGDGLRVEKTVAGISQHFAWDVAGGLPLLLDDGMTSHVYGPTGQPLEQIADNAPGTITRVATGSSAITSSNSITVQISSGVRVYDQILISVTENGTDTVSAPGYSVVQREATSNRTPTVTTLLRKTAAGGETSATLTFGAVASAATATAAVYRGADPTNPIGPIDGPSAAATGSKTAKTLAVGPVTATYSGEILVVAQGAAAFNSASSWTAPTGMTEAVVQSSQASAAGALADQSLSSAGSTGTRTITFGTNAQLMAIMVALRPQPSVLYVHGDQLGSTRMLTDSSGAVRGTFTFDAYGSLLTASGTASTPLLFDGQYADTESGFLYLRARSYDPATGQFLSRDPLLPLTLHPYAYAGGNPVNWSDRTGLADSPNNGEYPGKAGYGTGWSPYTSRSEKFDEHGPESGADTEESFQENLEALWDRAMNDPSVKTRVDANGFIRIYDERRHAMGVYDENGLPANYLPGISRKYWESQDASGYEYGETSLSNYFRASLSMWPWLQRLTGSHSCG